MKDREHLSQRPADQCPALSFTRKSWMDGGALPVDSTCSKFHPGQVHEQFGTAVKIVHINMLPGTKTGWLDKVHDPIT